MGSSSSPDSEVCSVPCWVNINGRRWNKELAFAFYQPGISLASGLRKAVLCQSQMAPDGGSCSSMGAFSICVPEREADGTL